jgi:hypothetical protein
VTFAWGLEVVNSEALRLHPEAGAALAVGDPIISLSWR